MAGLVELLGIERATNAKGQTAVDLGVVGEGRNAEVVDLGLPKPLAIFVCNDYCFTNLGERGRVDLVLGSKLKTNGTLRLGVPGGTGTGLNGGVDLLVVGRGEDAERVGRGDGGVVDGGGVSDGSRVLGDGSLLDVVANLTTDEEALVAQDSIGGGADSARGLEVTEDAAVEVVLLEQKVDLLALVSSVGLEVAEDLGLQARGKGVVELNLCGEEVGGVPRLGDADACPALRQHAYCVACA